MSSKIKLTQSVVSKLPLPSSAQADVWDIEQPGFGVRVGKSGRKVYFVMARVNGRQVRATVGKFPELCVDDARKEARRKLVEMSEGINPNDERKQSRSDALQLRPVFESFMRDRRNLSASTRNGYTKVFERYLACWSNRYVGGITNQMVLDLHLKIGESRGKNVANQAMRLLRVTLNHSRAVKGVPKVNPVSVLSAAKAWYKDGRRSVIVTEKDMPAWYSAVDSMENELGRDFLFLVLFTGLRKSEAMGLRWQDIDLDAGVLTVPEGTYDGDHVIPLPKNIISLLIARRERWKACGDYVFATWGKEGHISYVDHLLKDVRNKSGVYFTLHDLRRTFITTAESLDISVWAVKRLANHKQTDVTGKHYVVHEIERLRGPMERISLELLRRSGKPVP